MTASSLGSPRTRGPRDSASGTQSAVCRGSVKLPGMPADCGNAKPGGITPTMVYGDAVQVDRPADDRGIGTEAIPPQSIAEDDFELVARPIFVRAERRGRVAERHPSDGKEPGGHARAVEPRRLAGARQIERLAEKGAEIARRRGLSPAKVRKSTRPQGISSNPTLNRRRRNPPRKHDAIDVRDTAAASAESR